MLRKILCPKRTSDVLSSDDSTTLPGRNSSLSSDCSLRIRRTCCRDLTLQLPMFSDSNSQLDTESAERFRTRGRGLCGGRRGHGHGPGSAQREKVCVRMGRGEEGTDAKTDLSVHGSVASAAAAVTAEAAVSEAALSELATAAPGSVPEPEPDVGLLSWLLPAL